MEVSKKVEVKFGCLQSVAKVKKKKVHCPVCLPTMLWQVMNPSLQADFQLE